MSEWSILGPLVLGIVIGFIELFFVHQDEAGMGWLGHGLHAIPMMVIFLFISMNLSWALSFIGQEENMLIDLGARILIGIIATAKIKVAAAVVSKAGEKTIHALIIGLLIIVAPYAWEFVIAQMFAGMNLPVQ